MLVIAPTPEEAHSPEFSKRWCRLQYAPWNVGHVRIAQSVGQTNAAWGGRHRRSRRPRGKQVMPPADRIYDPGQGTKKDLTNTGDDFLAIGPALRIMQLNVEGLSAAKHEVIRSIAERQKIDVICLEETHVDVDKNNRFSSSDIPCMLNKDELHMSESTFLMHTMWGYEWNAMNSLS